MAPVVKVVILGAAVNMMRMGVMAVIISKVNVTCGGCGGDGGDLSLIMESVFVIEAQNV